MFLIDIFNSLDNLTKILIVIMFVCVVCLAFGLIKAIEINYEIEKTFAKWKRNNWL